MKKTKKYVIIKVIAAGLGTDRSTQPDGTEREEVNFFITKKEALKRFNNDEQFQSKTEGEQNRLLCKIEMTKR